MSSRRRAIVVAAIAAAIAVIVLWRWPRAAHAPAAPPSASSAASEPDRDASAHAPRELRRPPRTAPVAPDPGRRTSRHGSFTADSMCQFGPRSRCERARALAVVCDGGDAAACDAIAALWMTPPVQPMFARIASTWACTLGEVGACEREDHYLAYQQWPDGRPDDPSPVVDCERGDPTACWVLTWKSYQAKSLDEPSARRACDLGIADACGLLAQVARDPAAVVGLLDRACEQGSSLHCGQLVDLLALTDPARAAHYAERYEEIAGEPYEPDPSDD